MTVGSWRDWPAHHLRLNPQQRFEIYRSVSASATLRDATYWAEILFSAGIATLGLTLGSPAVIIGAMLISPLMGPILSTGLALAAGDFVLAIRSAIVVVLSSLVAVIFSTALVVLLPFREMTAEIAARTQPNTLDLIIALFSGAIGALAVSKSVGGVATSLPGVAIAVALMPPLCVTGYGVGVLVTVDRVQGLSVLRGGALLFVTNLVAITFTSMLLFLILHFDSDEVRERVRSSPDLPDPAVLPPRLARLGSLPARLLMVVVMVAVVFVPLKRSFDALVSEIRGRQKLNAVQREALSAWEALFGRTASGQPRSYIDRFDAEERQDKLLLTVRVFTTESVSENERQAYVRQVARALKRAPESLDLSLVEIPTSQYKVATGKTEAELKPAPPPPTLGQRLTAVAEETRRAAKAVPLPAGVMVLNADVTLAPDAPVITFAYLAPEAMSGDALSLVERSVRERFDLPRADVRFAWLPDRATIGPLPLRGEAPAELEPSLGRVREAMRRAPALQVTVLTKAADAERYGAMVTTALQTLGVPSSRIAMALSESIPSRTVELTLAVPQAP